VDELADVSGPRIGGQELRRVTAGVVADVLAESKRDTGASITVLRDGSETVVEIPPTPEKW
jgi:hypothetical protein